VHADDGNLLDKIRKQNTKGLLEANRVAGLKVNAQKTCSYLTAIVHNKIII
jgi:hypothetical protein